MGIVGVKACARVQEEVPAAERCDVAVVRLHVHVAAVLDVDVVNLKVLIALVPQQVHRAVVLDREVPQRRELTLNHNISTSARHVLGRSEATAVPHHRGEGKVLALQAFLIYRVAVCWREVGLLVVPHNQCAGVVALDVVRREPYAMASEVQRALAVYVRLVEHVVLVGEEFLVVLEHEPRRPVMRHKLRLQRLLRLLAPVELKLVDGCP